LPPIVNSQSSVSDIRRWKGRPEVKRCYKKLFKKINGDESAMTKIIERLWPKKHERENASKIQMAFAISIVVIYLNPNNHIIQVNEQTIKPLIIKSMVSLFLNFIQTIKCVMFECVFN